MDLLEEQQLHFGNLDADGGWDQDADGVNFGLSGVFTGSLAGGTNYGGKTDYTTSGALNSGVDDLISGYELFSNTEEIEVDFILDGCCSSSDKINLKQLQKNVSLLQKQEKMQLHLFHLIVKHS